MTTTALDRAHAQHITIEGRTLDGAYKVRGSTGARYFVEIAHGHAVKCSCPSRVYCKHQAAVEEEIGRSIARQAALEAEAQAADRVRDAALLARPNDNASPRWWRAS